MLKKLRLPLMVLGTAFALLAPTGAFARDHDDWRHERHERREHERREWREHHRRVRVYVGNGYAYGYYDRGGYWHPYYR